MSATKTAGDVLRDALADGQGKSTIARRLAGKGAGPAELERWRAVVVRADRGGEPREEIASHIGEVFGVAVSQPTHYQERTNRLGALEEAIELLRPELTRLAERVEALERMYSSPGWQRSAGRSP